jgi:peptide/nickel transport system substrate-binding protein
VASMMSRRELLAYAAAAGAGGLFLDACSSNGTKTAGVGPTASSGSSSGSLSVGMRATLSSLTPLGTQPYQWSQMMGFALYDPLVKIESDGTLSPVLAESWDISSPTETIINVRPGVKFSNGAPVTAEDVAYSIAARSNPTLIAQTSGRAVMTPEQWRSADVLSTYQLRINTTDRTRILTQPQPVLVIPNNAFTKYNLNTQAVGSGPFTVDQFVSGTSLSVTANPHYWGGAPSIKSLTFRFFTDVSDEALNLRSGEINAVYDVAPLNLKQVSGISGTKVVHEATYADWWIIQMGKPPLNDPAVRRALRYCFNMDLINTSAFGGLGTNPWNPFDFYPSQYQNSGATLDISYDPDQAKSLLKAAGASNITVPIIGINTYQDSINEGQIIEQGLQAAGVNANFQALTVNAWLDVTYGKGTWDGIAFNAGNIPVPFLNLWDYLVDPAVLISAYSKAPDPSVAALYNQVETGSDAQEPALLQQAQQVLINEAVAYFMFGAPVSMVLPENLTGVETNGYGDVRWNNAAL